MAIDLRDLERLIAEKDFKTVRAELNNLQDADIAAFMEELRREHVVMVFRSLPKDRAAEIFSYLPSDMQQYIVEAITDQEISNIINDLFMDDAADFLEEMPANVVKRVLRNASPDVRELINHFLKYPPYSAGSIMTAEFVDLRKTMTVAEAFQRIRRTALDKETVYTCYVMDDNRRLEGVVTVRELFLAEEDAVIGDIMEKNVIFVRTGDDQEEVPLPPSTTSCPCRWWMRRTGWWASSPSTTSWKLSTRRLRKTSRRWRPWCLRKNPT